MTWDFTNGGFSKVNSTFTLRFALQAASGEPTLPLIVQSRWVLRNISLFALAVTLVVAWLRASACEPPAAKAAGTATRGANKLTYLGAAKKGGLIPSGAHYTAKLVALDAAGNASRPKALHLGIDAPTGR